MIKKIVFVFCKFFEQKDWDIFDCPYYLKQGYEVEIWSLVHLHYEKRLEPPKNLFKDYDVKYFKGIDQYESGIKRNDRKTTVFLIYPSLGENLKTGYLIRKLIRKHGFRYCDYMYPPVPLKSGYLTNRRDITFWYLENIRNQDIIEQLLFSLLCPPEYVFVGARASLAYVANKYDALNRHRLQFINTPDYDKYLVQNTNTDLSLLERENLKKGNYIVFLDEAHTHHSDHVNAGLRVTVTEDVYGREMRKMFDRIEKETNMEIVIALHPKAEYAGDAIYGGRKMIQGESRVLIRYASFVIFNYSTALSYVMLYKKELMLYTTDQLNRCYSWHRSAQAELTKVLGCKIVNASKELPADLVKKYRCKVDEKKRKNYINNFVRCKGKTKSSHIIDKCLKNLD